MTHDAELATLGRLLDDPSPVVRQAVLAKLKAAGLPGVLWLEGLASDETLATHARALLADLRTPEAAAHAFLAHLRTPTVDLEAACLLLERTSDPTLADDVYAREFDRLAERTRELIAEPLDVRAKCRLLCRVLFGEEGYRGAQESFAVPDSSLLSQVIQARRGIPISLCLVFLFVARRLGLPVEPVGLPGRFMVGIFRGREPLYIDCYEGGAFRTRAEVQLLLLDNHLPADEAFLQPVTTTQTLARCCRNLVSQCEAQGDDRRSRLFLTFVQALEKTDERA
jgi:regulator of sirC expression with transglutaminase-like and TPR domain